MRARLKSAVPLLLVLEARPYEALLDENEVFQQVVAPKRTRRGLPSGDGATTA